METAINPTPARIAMTYDRLTISWSLSASTETSQQAASPNNLTVSPRKQLIYVCIFKNWRRVKKVDSGTGSSTWLPLSAVSRLHEKQQGSSRTSPPSASPPHTSKSAHKPYQTQGSVSMLHLNSLSFDSCFQLCPSPVSTPPGPD